MAERYIDYRLEGTPPQGSRQWVDCPPPLASNGHTRLRHPRASAHLHNIMIPMLCCFQTIYQKMVILLSSGAWVTMYHRLTSLIVTRLPLKEPLFNSASSPCVSPHGRTLSTHLHNVQNHIYIHFRVWVTSHSSSPSPRRSHFTLFHWSPDCISSLI